MHDEFSTRRDTIDLREIDRTQVARVGGKGAHLGELTRLEGVSVPDGFCVTTDAFRRVVAPSLGARLDRLALLAPGDQGAIREHSAAIRQAIEDITLPDDLADAITGALDQLGARTACAVRSSATAEDLPTASFAGQQDTYLNVIGPDDTRRHVVRCWASLFTERAVTYRARNGLDHRRVAMAVVVQRMVFPQAAGILFTADPITGHRKVTSIEASFGLGEALVAGLVNADTLRVREGVVIGRAIGDKRLAILASPGGGTAQQAIAAERRQQPALTDGQAVQLAQLGRRIEAHLGCPQDIEWCLADGSFWIVQSRPITTLFPVPAASDGQNRVYVSVGHQQMMTDAMMPLGLSLFQLTALRPMADAAGRLFVDVTPLLASPAGRATLIDGLGRSDPLIRDALQTVVDRGDFVSPLPAAAPGTATGAATGAVRPPAPAAPIEPDPAIVAGLIERTQASIAALRREIATRSGPALVDFILDDIQELKRLLVDPLSHQAIMAAMEAAWWLNDHLHEWLGEKNVADVLTQSVPHNVTSEMGLALLDVADVIRPCPEVVAFLAGVEGDDFLDALGALPGGREARDALQGYLDRYGMRGVGEIDITRPRWGERPGLLVPLLLGNIRNFAPGAGARRLEQGLQEAARKEREVLDRLRALPDGEARAAETRRRIALVRTFAGHREYPKYGIVSRYALYKQALMAEAGRLVEAGALRERDDVFFLTLPEVRDAARDGRVDQALIAQRKEAFRSYQALTPPRVITSDGEVINGAYRRDGLPPGALVGLAVSAGVVEGRARVILDLARADLEAGDILVTAYTDPSWTPAFVAIAGLVTEVGGQMTHGAVIAREYGLPAVVGVEQATRRIADGQRIRVHGTDGYVEILP